MKEILIVAGPNGAGKTTFAGAFVPNYPALSAFVNADLIAAGLSPFAPEKEAIQAGKLMLAQIDKLVSLRENFSFETTLAGLGYRRKIPEWQAAGYFVTLLFLQLPNADTAVRRVALRVSQGGHKIREDVIRRRFQKGLENFHAVYKPIVDRWYLYDNAGSSQVLLETGGKDCA